MKVPVQSLEVFFLHQRKNQTHLTIRLDFSFIWKGAQLGPLGPLGPNPVSGWVLWAPDFQIGSYPSNKFRGGKCTFWGGWGKVGVGEGGGEQLVIYFIKNTV